jgi:hypothetical protein
MPSAGFEHAIPANKRPKTYDSDLEATGIGSEIPTRFKFHIFLPAYGAAQYKKNTRTCVPVASTIWTHRRSV